VFNTRILLDSICILFILLFVYAASNKLLDFQKFKVQLGQSPLLTHLVDFTALFIPILEIIISLILCFPKLRLIGLYFSFTLMTMFTLYIISILNFSEHIPCSCGGVLQNMSWKQHLVFNIGFVLLGLFGILIYPRPTTKPPL